MRNPNICRRMRWLYLDKIWFSSFFVSSFKIQPKPRLFAFEFYFSIIKLDFSSACFATEITEKQSAHNVYMFTT